MKTKFLLLAVVVAPLTFTSGALGSDAYLSPRARQSRDDFRTAPGTTPDMLDRSIKSASPRVAQLRHDFHKVPGTTPDMLARRLPPVSPRVASQPWRLRDYQIQEYQIAPLK